MRWTTVEEGGEGGEGETLVSLSSRKRTDPDSVDRGRAFGAAHYLIRTMKSLFVS